MVARAMVLLAVVTGCATALQTGGWVSPARLSQAVLGEASGQAAHAQCRSDFQRWIADLAAGERWALEMTDSWAQTVSGVFYGNTIDFGNFDECLQTSSKSENTSFEDNPVIRGAYVLPVVTISSNETRGGASPSAASLRLRELVPVSLRVAFCVPDSCSAEILVAALQRVAGDLLREGGLSDQFQAAVTLPTGKQSEANRHRPGAGHWAFLAVVVSLLLVAVIATFVDNNLDPSNKHGRARWRVLLHFSLSSGWRRLVAPAPSGSMSSINGLRVLSTIWITVGHCAENYPSVINGWDQKEVRESVPYMMINGYFLAVDTFLAIGGLVCCISFMRVVKKKGFNWFEYIVHRYARITPVLILTTAFGATWFDIAQGADSFVRGRDAFINWYKEKWWCNLVYISNFTGEILKIAPHSWYLSVDMQLYILAPIFLIPLWKYPRVGKYLLALGTIISCIVPATLSALYQARDSYATGSRDIPETVRIKKALYFGTQSRFSPYMVGIAAGYFLYQLKFEGLKIRLTRVHALAMWLLSTGIGLAIIFGPYSLLKADTHPYNMVESIFYVGLTKLAWGLSIVLVIILCETGNGGPVMKILSWGVFASTGRLCFCVYLIHYFVVNINAWFFFHTAEYFSVYGLILNVLSSVAITTPIAALLFLVVEQPFISLEGEVWKAARARKPV